MIPELVEAPASLPVTAEEARAWCRVALDDYDDDADEDLVFDIAIASSVERLDGYTGILRRCIVTQDWREYAPRFRTERGVYGVSLTLAPVSEIVSVKYLPETGGPLTDIPAADYRFGTDAEGPYVALLPGKRPPAMADRPDALQVVYRAGYGEPADVPAPLKSAILSLVAHRYEMREAVSDMEPFEVPLSVRADLAPFKRYRLG